VKEGNRRHDLNNEKTRDAYDYENDRGRSLETRETPKGGQVWRMGDPAI